MLFKKLSLALAAILLLTFSLPRAAAAEAPRVILVKAVLTEDSASQIELIKQVTGDSDELVNRGLTAWRASELYLYEVSGGEKIPFLLDAQQDAAGTVQGIQILNGQPVKDATGAIVRFKAADLTAVDTNSRLRRAIKTALDLYAMGNPVPKMRRDAVIKLGQEQNVEYLPFFELRLKSEQDEQVTFALNEAIAMTQAVSSDAKVQKEAIRKLGEMRSVNGVSFLQQLQKDVKAGTKKLEPDVTVALTSAVVQIENYQWWGNLVGTGFRGLSLAAVLLVAALGLAITFGLMGIINMAHGEIIMVGAYTAYVTQNIFKGWFGASGVGFNMYFIAALVTSFIVAALVGLLLERTIIRFLYKRPLESLLATWGVSLVLQQIFRHIFGAANVQVSSPSWLSGSFVVNDVLFAYNRIFVIGFAVFIVFCTYLLLTRTSLGLQIRAVMQNRAMASCIGVRTDRVNMMTFAFGSGLAGVAGACLSQIGNVGPSLGQSHIVDCFMIVVLGGVGNLVGTVSAALGVGVTIQTLEPWLGAVMGKIIVLSAIILFLQWRPAGLFAVRSRSLD